MWIEHSFKFEGKYQAIPESIREKIRLYVEDRKVPNVFLTAIILGDLFTALEFSDSGRVPGLKSEEEAKEMLLYRKHLVLIAEWFVSYFPHLTGPQNYADWVGHREDE